MNRFITLVLAVFVIAAGLQIGSTPARADSKTQMDAHCGSSCTSADVTAAPNDGAIVSEPGETATSTKGNRPSHFPGRNYKFQIGCGVDRNTAYHGWSSAIKDAATYWDHAVALQTDDANYGVPALFNFDYVKERTCKLWFGDKTSTVTVRNSFPQRWIDRGCIASWSACSVPTTERRGNCNGTATTDTCRRLEMDIIFRAPAVQAPRANVPHCSGTDPAFNEGFGGQNEAFNIIKHELGHATGVQHSTRKWSVMYQPPPNVGEPSAGKCWEKDKSGAGNTTATVSQGVLPYDALLVEYLYETVY